MAPAYIGLKTGTGSAKLEGTHRQRGHAMTLKVQAIAKDGGGLANDHTLSSPWTGRAPLYVSSAHFCTLWGGTIFPEGGCRLKMLR